jgi:hypothetical protein
MNHSTHHSANRLGDLGPRVFQVGAGVGLAALAVSALVAWRTDHGWEPFLRAYVWAFCVVTSISLGALFFIMIQHLTKAGWSVVVRRVAEGLAGNLRWLWIFFIPILLGMKFSDSTHLYHWAMTGATEHDHILAHKEPYLNPTFWTIRAGAYFLIWALMARFFLRTSVQQDSSGDPQLTLRMQAMAAPGVGIWFITQTFAAIDWIMSLEPHWFSTMFGVYFFAASWGAFYATIILLLIGLQKRGLMREVTAEHFHDLGKWLFAIGAVFWAYIAYSQFMLIWYANLPEETMWFVPRMLGPWLWVSYFLIAGHFLLPFAALLSRHPKRRPAALAVLAGWMLLVHMVDLYWLVMPQVPPSDVIQAAGSVEALQAMVDARHLSLGLNLHHVLTIVGLGALLLAGTAATLRACSLVPARASMSPWRLRISESKEACEAARGIENLSGS